MITIFIILTATIIMFILYNKKNTIVVENLTRDDKQSMSFCYFGKYQMFESIVIMKDYLDSSENDGSVSEVSNIFQVVSEEGDPEIIVYTHSKRGETWSLKFRSLWPGRCDIREEEIKIAFQDAFKKVHSSAIQKPHSRYCILKKEPGKNPQYVFGDQIYLDAITGEIKL